MRKMNKNEMNKAAIEKMEMLCDMFKAYADEYMEDNDDIANTLAICAGWMEQALKADVTIDGLWARISDGLF